MKFWLGVLATLLVLQPREVASTTQYQTIVQTVYIEEEIVPPSDTTSASVREAERQGVCLWYFMKEKGLEITLENVLVSGEWTDINGGACFLIGEDDE